MIRAAIRSDIPAILRMGKVFFDQAPWPEFADWDPPSIEKTLAMIADGALPGILLVAERDRAAIGMACCLLFPLYFNHHQTAAQEIFWWIEPEHRRGIGAQMFDALEAEAKERGAVCFFASATAGLRTDALDRLYRRRGFKPAEFNYLKRL